MSDEHEMKAHGDLDRKSAYINRSLQAYKGLYEDIRALMIRELEAIEKSETERPGVPMSDANRARFDLMLELSDIMQRAQTAAEGDQNVG
jgi:hypothetical protein